MKYHKLIAGETTGTYIMESPVTEADILRMAQQLAMSRLSKGRVLTDPKQVFSHLQTLLQYHEHEVFALLLLDTRHRVICFRELFRGTLDGASVYPREVVKIALVCCSRNNFPNYSPTLQVSFLPRRVPGECSGYNA